MFLHFIVMRIVARTTVRSVERHRVVAAARGLLLGLSVSATVLCCAARPAVAAAYSTCPTGEEPTVRVHSGSTPPATHGSGLLTTDDATMYIALEAARGGRTRTRWAVLGETGQPVSLLSTWHTVVANDGAAIVPALPVEERVPAATTALLLSDSGRNTCRFRLRVLPLDLLGAAQKHLIVILAPGATPLKNPQHFDAIAIGNTGAALTDVSLNFTADAEPQLRMTGHLELGGNSDFLSKTLVAFATSGSGTPRLALDPSTPAEFDVASPRGRDWSEPPLDLTKFALGKRDTDDCTGAADWRLEPPITFREPDGPPTHVIPLKLLCSKGRLSAFGWTPSGHGRGLVNWGNDNDRALQVCPLFNNITISVSPDATGRRRYVDDSGSVLFHTVTSQPFDCLAAAKTGAPAPQSATAAASDNSKNLELSVDDVGEATAPTGYYPVAHFIGDYKEFDRLRENDALRGVVGLAAPSSLDKSMRICSVEGQFEDKTDELGHDQAGIALKISAQIAAAVTLPAPAGKSDSTDQTPTVATLNTPPPCQGAPLAPSPATSATPSSTAPLQLNLKVKNISAFIPTGRYTYMASPTNWENYSFADAAIDIGAKNTLFGREVESCGSSVAVAGGMKAASRDGSASPAQTGATATLASPADTGAPAATSSRPDTGAPAATSLPSPSPIEVAALNKLTLGPNRLCIGLHISPQHSSADNDTAFGLLELCKTAVDSGGEVDTANAGLQKCPATSTSPSAFAATGFVAELPSTRPAKVRVGLTTLTVNDFKIEAVRDAPSFDAAVGVDRLSYLGCSDLNVVGSASFAVIATPKSTPLNALEGAAALTAGAASGVAGLADQNPFTVTPSLAMGQNCTVFSMQGFVPLQLTAQSLITITSLVFVSSKDSDNHDLFYFNAAGSVTSGNVTGVFSSLGFRTKAKRALTDPKTKHVIPDSCMKSHHETTFGNLCVVSDINWPLTAGITAAQNSSQITQALSGLFGAAFGLAVRH